MDEDLNPDMLLKIRKAVDTLRAGGIVAYPTDTIYGLGADIFNDAAVAKIFAVKGRPPDQPLPVLIADTGQLSALISELTVTAERLLSRFWPGGLTIVFNKAAGLRSMALGGSNRIGIRIPSHKGTLLMIRELGRPLIGTSANLHGGTVALTADDVRRELGDKVDYIVDGGACTGGRESTVIDVTVDPPLILREGIIDKEAIVSAYKATAGGI